MDERIKRWYNIGMDILDELKKDNDISEGDYEWAREKMITITKLSLKADKAYDSKKKRMAMA